MESKIAYPLLSPTYTLLTLNIKYTVGQAQCDIILSRSYGVWVHQVLHDKSEGPGKLTQD